MSAGRESAGEGGFGFPRAARITASDEIRSLFRRGKRRKTRHLDVFLASSPAARSRVGLVVPKHRRTAVARNLVKRRLREICRTELLPTLRSAGIEMDILVRARPEAYSARYEELRDELRTIAEVACSSER